MYSLSYIIINSDIIFCRRIAHQEGKTSTEEREMANERALPLSFCAENNKDYREVLNTGEDRCQLYIPSIRGP